MSGTEVTLQVDLGGMSIACVGHVEDGDVLGLNAMLDDFARAAGRQRAKITLAEKLVDLMAAKKTLAGLPERERDLLRNRAEERVRQRAAMEAAHNARGKQAGFLPNPQQRRALDQFDEQTEQERRKLADQKTGLEMQLPIIEAQISRLRAVIAGRDPTEALEDERQSLDRPEAAEAAD